MNWEIIATIAELLGAVGVILTLIYVALQVKQHSIALSREAARHASISNQPVAAAQMNPEVAAIIAKAFLDEEVDLVEQTILDAYFGNWLSTWQECFYDHEVGVLSDEHWEGVLNQMREFMATRACRQGWHVNKTLYTSRFRNLVEEVIQTVPDLVPLDQQLQAFQELESHRAAASKPE